MAAMYIIEARTPDGAINPAPAAQPPFNVMSERQLFEYRNDNVTGAGWLYEGQPGHLEAVKEWFASNGWHVRPKTW